MKITLIILFRWPREYLRYGDKYIKGDNSNKFFTISDFKDNLKDKEEFDEIMEDEGEDSKIYILIHTLTFLVSVDEEEEKKGCQENDKDATLVDQLSTPISFE